jgi:hypothetical protein
MNRQPRRHFERHLDQIRQCPCVVCHDDTSTEASHVRMPSPRAGKRNSGKGEKPDDVYVVPLCGRHHREQHEIGEREFWASVRIDPIFTALALWSWTGNHEKMTEVAMHAHEREMA